MARRGVCGMCERGKMETLATYVVVELDVGILNESEKVGELFVCISSRQSFLCGGLG